MSRETIEWLNDNTLIGHTTDKDVWAKNSWVIMGNDGVAKAWWQVDGYTGGYPGAIPVDEVNRRLFNWEPTESDIMLKVPCDEADADAQDGNGQWFRWVADTERKAIVHPNSNFVFGYFGQDSYKIHPYGEWLINNVGKIVDGEVGIDSAGLLRNGGVAYVTLSLPADVQTNSGFAFRPTIVATTSVDGTRATTYALVPFIPVCDNSLHASIHQASGKFKVKHSSKSLTKIGDAREALGLIYQGGEEFIQLIDRMADVEMTDQQFKAIVEQMVVVPEPTGKNKAAITKAEEKQAELWLMYGKDPRAAQWNGTLLGAYQAVNTWNEHCRSRNDNLVERVMTGVISDQFAKMDHEFWSIVGDIVDLSVLVSN